MFSTPEERLERGTSNLAGKIAQITNYAAPIEYVECLFVGGLNRAS
jgi:hypothetical protein